MVKEIKLSLARATESCPLLVNIQERHLLLDDVSKYLQQSREGSRDVVGPRLEDMIEGVLK